MKLETEIAVIQEQIKSIVEDIHSVKDNHLPSIYNRLSRIERNLAYYAGGLAVLTVLLKLLA